MFKLRPYTLNDIPSLVKHANNNNVARFLTDRFPHPYSEEDAEQFIRMAMEKDPAEIFAIDIDGNAVGSIGIHPQSDIHRRNAELGYWLSEEHWGRGIIPEAIGQMVKYGFGNFDIDRIFARPFSTNARSQRVLEKAGFKLEARFEKTLIKNGECMDELVYAIRKI